jgi:beta-lactamase regulating signal transducer with metallopeptidase domain
MNDLFNHLWQTTLFAAAITLITLAMRRNPARTRYWLWMVASLKFLVPFSVLFVAGSRIEQPAGLTSISGEFIEQVTATFTPVEFSAAPTRDWSRALMAIWLLGVLAVSVRWLRAWWRVRHIARLGVPAGINAPIPVLSTAAAIEPGIFGILRPVLLLPASITEKLSAGEIRSLVTHELCHLKSRDNLTAAIHMVVSAIFWFHPAVWWIGGRLIEERERPATNMFSDKAIRPKHMRSPFSLSVNTTRNRGWLVPPA